MYTCLFHSKIETNLDIIYKNQGNAFQSQKLSVLNRMNTCMKLPKVFVLLCWDDD